MEVPVPSQDNHVHVYMFVKGVKFALVSTIFQFNFEMFSWYGNLCFHLITGNFNELILGIHGDYFFAFEIVRFECI